MKNIFPFFQKRNSVNKNILSMVEKIIKEKLTYLEKDALLDLVNIAISNEKKHIDGIMIETGCALGGSAIALASAKNRDRHFYIYDVFGMIPPPSEKDDEDVHERYNIIATGNSVGIENDLYYGYEENLYDKVVQSFKSFDFEVGENNIHLIKGL